MTSWLHEQNTLQKLGKNRRTAALLAAGFLADASPHAAAYDATAPMAERAKAIEGLHNAGVRDMRRHGVQMRGLKHYRPIKLSGATLPTDQRDTHLHVTGSAINADHANLSGARWTLDTPDLSLQSAGGVDIGLCGEATHLNMTGFYARNLRATMKAHGLKAESVMVHGSMLELDAPHAKISGAISNTNTYGSDFRYGDIDVTAPNADFSHTNFKGARLSVDSEFEGRFYGSNMTDVKTTSTTGLRLLTTGAENTNHIAEIDGHKLDSHDIKPPVRGAIINHLVAARYAYQLRNPV